MHQLFGAVQGSQAVEPVVWNFGYADVGFAWICKSMLGELCLGQDTEKRAFANLRQSYDSSFHKYLIVMKT
jgi:hypothetical protein